MHIRPLADDIEVAGLPELDENARLILRQDFRMRKDERFVAFWRVGDDAGVWDFGRLDPATAVMVALFDGERTVGQVISDFSAAAQVPAEKARVALRRFIAGGEGRLVPINGIPKEKLRCYDPRFFVMSPAKVDLGWKRPSAPMALIWLLTNTCVADCIYCFAERQRHDQAGRLLSLARIIEILEEAASYQVSGVVLEGGDPFTHPHIVEVVRAMLERKIHIAASTKCGLSEAMIGRLAETGLRRLQVSIDTVDPEVHALLTGAPGLLEKSMMTVRNAAAAGFTTLVNAVLTPYNVHQIRPLLEKMLELGSTSIHFSPYARSGYVAREDLFLSEDELNRVGEEILKLQEQYPDKTIRMDRVAELPFAERGICTAGVNSLTIHPDGKCVLCEQAPSDGPAVVGDLSVESLYEVWNSPRVEEFLLPDQSLFGDTACATCPDFSLCHEIRGRCFIQSFQAYGKLFAPQPICPRAPRPKVRPWSERPHNADKLADLTSAAASA